MSAELDFEVLPGVPNGLPEGERVIWQGRPKWTALARHGFGLSWFAVYLAAIVAFRLIEGAGDPASAVGIGDVALMHGMSGLLLGIIAGFAVLYARSTVYTITSRRVLFRSGVALPMTWNLPFKQIASADLRVLDGGAADIVLSLAAPNRVGWLHLWPNVDSWNPLRPTRPTLRALADGRRAAALFAEAVRAWAASTSAEVKVSAAAEVPSKEGTDLHPTLAAEAR